MKSYGLFLPPSVTECLNYKLELIHSGRQIHPSDSSSSPSVSAAVPPRVPENHQASHHNQMPQSYRSTWTLLKLSSAKSTVIQRSERNRIQDSPRLNVLIPARDRSGSLVKGVDKISDQIIVHLLRGGSQSPGDGLAAVRALVKTPLSIFTGCELS